MEDNEIKALEKEISILRKLKHRNICMLREVFQDRDMLYMIMEELTGGELFDRIVQKEFYSESEAAKVIREICSALAFCHKHGIAHRDLKPENILYASNDEDSEVKVADFGLADILPKNKLLQTPCGTPEYVAPEILHKQPYSTQVDMWGLGIIAYILLCGYPPFEGDTQEELYRAIRGCKAAYTGKEWDFVSAEGTQFVQSLLHSDPKTRLTAAQVMQHKWLERTEPTLSSKYPSEDLHATRARLAKTMARRRLKGAMKAVLNIALMRKMAKLGPISQMKAAGSAATSTAASAHTTSDHATSTKTTKSNAVEPDSTTGTPTTKKKSKCIVC